MSDPSTRPSPADTARPASRGGARGPARGPAVATAALLSAAAVALVELGLALTGWVRDPTLGYLAWLPLPFALLFTARGVRGSAREGRDYSGQLIAGAEIGLLGGVLAAALTWLVHAQLAPETLVDVQRLAEARVLAAGGDPRAVADAVGLASPLSRGLLRFIELLFASALCGLAVARRPAR